MKNCLLMFNLEDGNKYHTCICMHVFINIHTHIQCKYTHILFIQISLNYRIIVSAFLVQIRGSMIAFFTTQYVR